jgi:hydrogenase-4 component F
MLLALAAVPALGAAGAYAHRAAAWRTAWLVGTAVVHAALVAAVWSARPDPVLAGWFALDDLGLLVLTVVSALFLVAAVYGVGFLRHESPWSGRAFVSGLLAFLAAASLVTISHHLGILWVGMEAATLAVAPLIYHRHDRRSLEAVWKYLVLSSVGIALALLGTFFLATAQVATTTLDRPLLVADLVRGARQLHPAWLKAAFVFLLAGYGTKMGLAPLHTWKPDTYGEAPGMVGALMAGGLTSLAFLGIARVMQVVAAAGLTSFARPVLIAFGLLSLVVAAAFVLSQTDLKRLLAYSSVEHMGLLVLGLGIGGAGVYGSALHLMNNALAKGVLFLAVGNVVLATGTSASGALRGLGRTLPVSAALLVVGLFAATGSPPFAPFVSEFIILQAALSGGHVILAFIVVALLVVIFAGMALTTLRVVHGEPDPATRPGRENAWLVIGPVALAVALLLLGFYLPTSLGGVLRHAATALGGATP